jgi:hypothetical protein
VRRATKPLDYTKTRDSSSCHTNYVQTYCRFSFFAFLKPQIRRIETITCLHSSSLKYELMVLSLVDSADFNRLGCQNHDALHILFFATCNKLLNWSSLPPLMSAVQPINAPSTISKVAFPNLRTATVTLFQALMLQYFLI